jgi:hypothetical protein
MPGSCSCIFAARAEGGLFGDYGEPLAVAIYSNPVNKYLTDGAIELTRLVRLPSYKEPLSKFVCWSLRWLRANTPYAVCVSYADSAENHHGGIYQASGFYYCGEKGVPGDKVAGYKTESGAFLHARSINASYGTHKAEKILALFPKWSIVEALPKYLYVKPLRRNLKPLCRRYKWEILPFPKPNAARPLDEPLPRGASDVQPVGAAPNSENDW